MKYHNRLYKVISLLVVISMLLGSLPLPLYAFSLPAGPPAANNQLLDLDTLDAPAELAAPLGAARVQSGYQAGAPVVVTYTVRNHLTPVVLPAVAPGASYTDTAAAILAADFAGDPHTIRDVVLAVDLTDPAANLLDSNRPVDRDGDTLLINLGDLGPLATAEVALTISTPGSVTAFTSLDGGAVAHANWQARPVVAQAAPITLAPDGFAPFLVCTPDANCHDPYIVRQAGALGNDPDAIFEFVRSLGYEAYTGSLRGARGALWSAAGNGYDQASLLIALLRVSGIPAAYREGTLSTPDAQTLLADMFPLPPAVSGYIPAGTETADPLNDPDLLAEATAHAWVEAYLPASGTWTSLDPSFPTANPGDEFGTPTSGQLAELPDTVRHKVTVALEVEKYSAFPVGGSNLYTLDTPLEATFNVVSLVGEPLIFAHVVESSDPPGLVFSSVEHTYTPYFIAGVEETLVEGVPFGELISSFPFGQDFVVAEWLDITVTDPAGNSETYRRELFDDIGFAARQGGGLINDLARDQTPRVSTAASWNTLFAPSDVDPHAYLDTYAETVALAPQVVVAREAIAGMSDSDFPTPEVIAAATAATRVFGQMTRLVQRQHLLQFTALSDAGHDYLGATTLVKSYQDSPRVFTVGWDYVESSGESTVSFDLGRNKQRVLAYPGQTDIAAQGFRYAQTLLDLSLEAQVLEAVAPEPVVSVSAVFDQAIADDLEFVRITFGTLDELEPLNFSDQAKARITAALAENPRKFVIVPESEVTIPGADPTIGWLEIDSDTLETIDVMENGQHMAAGQYAIMGQFAKRVGSLVGGFGAGFVGATFGFWIGFFETVNNGGDGLAALAAGKDAAKEYGEKGKKACNKKSDKKWCKAGAAAGMNAGLSMISKADPPVQDTYLALPFDAAPITATASAVINAPAGLGGSNVTANVDTALAGVYGVTDVAWSGSAENNFAFTQLSIAAADVYSGGLLIDNGAILAVPAGTATTANALSDGTTLAISGTITGTVSLHAAAINPLGAGSQFDRYDLGLAAGGSYSLTVQNALVDVDGTPYTGNISLVTSQRTDLAGRGASAVPNHAAAFNTAGNSNGYTIFAPGGNPTVGGSSVSAPHGFALGNATGSATIAPATPFSDTFSYSGDADFFTLDLSASSSSVASGGAATFDALISANFTDNYTTTVYAPAGWQADINTSGQVSADSPAGTAPGDYRLLVSARSHTYPDLYVTAVHLVTITGVDGVVLEVEPDPQFTMPWGPYGTDTIDFDTRIGQYQLPGAAFTVDVTNTSSLERTFAVTVSSLPAGWSILNGQGDNTTAQLTLSGGQHVRLGLYVLPTSTTLDPPGTSYPFTVTAVAQDNGAVNDSDSDAFTILPVAYPGLVVDPVEINATANSTVAFDLAVTNIGTAPGTFDLFSTVPVTSWTVLPLDQPAVTLNPGESATQTISVTVTTGRPEIDYPVAVGAPAMGVPYTPTVAIDIYIAGINAGIIYDAADAVLACAAGGNLAAAFEGLAGAVNALEASCAAGACNPTDKLAAENAARQLAIVAARTPGVDATDLETAADTLAAAGDDTATLSALGDISAAVDALAANVCEAAEHLPGLVWTPGYNAGLPAQSVPYSLTLTNLGSVTTTYAVTVDVPAGTSNFNPTLNPGQDIAYGFGVAPAGLGLYNLEAAATAVGPDVQLPDLTATADAQHNVVDRFVQVLAVTPDPAFVESGTSSTDLSITVANVANLLQPATARTQIIAPAGGISYTADLPLNIVPGNPQIYPLATVNTSGWAEEVYTVTVDLLDNALAVIPDGSGYGLFAVGQGLGAAHSVTPETVAPGTFTVTTAITTEILAETIYNGNGPAGPLWEPTGLIETAADGEPETGAVTMEDNADYSDIQPDGTTITGTETISPVSGLRSPANTVTGTIIIRQEQDEAVYTGTWATQNLGRASQGSFITGDAIGETAAFTFDGSWINVGFIGDRRSGNAEIFVDGNSLGVVDLYRREDNQPISFAYGGLVTATHTLSVTVLGTAHPNAGDFDVQIDFLDSWNGGTYAPGTVEAEDGVRVFRGNGWSLPAESVASGGSYFRGNPGTLWYPFTGDSVSFQYLRARTFADNVKVYVDGQFITRINQYNKETITDTLSLENLGPGPHIMQVETYRGLGLADTFSSPGTAPFFTPPVPSGYWRYEIDNTAFLFNNEPYSQTAGTWVRENSFKDLLSDREVISSETAGDTAEITVTGEWIAVGFHGQEVGGHAEVFIDGLSQGIVDTYRTEQDAIYVSYTVAPGTHTVTIVVLGTQNPLSNDNEVEIDYVDVWDGTGLPNGSFDQTDPRILRSGDWVDTADALASNGYYMENGGSGTAWIPFLGDSISVQGFDYFRAHEVEIRVDGVSQGLYDLRGTSTPTPTYHFVGFGPGLHLLQIRDYRDYPTLDAVHIPALDVPPPPPPATPYTRYEENDPGFLYNGLPYLFTARTWDRENTFQLGARPSDGQIIGSATAGDTVSFNFTGPWLEIGFSTGPGSGLVEIVLDGNSQGLFDLYTTDNGVTTFPFPGLANGAHTLTLNVQGAANPLANGNWVYLDYVAVWDGTPIPTGTFEETDPRVYRSDRYDDWSLVSEPAASGGQYMTNNSSGYVTTVWFPFAGDSASFVGLANSSGGQVRISVDGQHVANVRLYSATPVSKTYSFDGFGSGPHIMEVRRRYGNPFIDAFTAPAAGPIYQTPVYTGLMRYEQDHPNIVYNSAHSYDQRPRTWDESLHAQASNWAAASSGTAGDSVSMTFAGRWVNAGFRNRNAVSEAEIFIDGLSQGVFDLRNYVGFEAHISVPFGGLITGTHTIEVVVTAGTVSLDFFDVWDGQPVSDDFVNARRGEDSGRMQTSSSPINATSPQAIDGDFLTSGLPNSNANVWYTFVGDAFSLYGFSRNNTTNADLYVDGVFIENVDYRYRFTPQPIVRHYTGFGPGAHVVRVHNNATMRIDGFRSNPTALIPYQPIVEWYDTAPGGNGGGLGGSVGIAASVAAGDIDNDGVVEIVLTADNLGAPDNNGTLFVYRGDGQDTGDGDPIEWKVNLNDAAFRTWLGAPGIADLDGLPGAEIVVNAGNELFAFYNDGSTYWSVPTDDAFETLSGPAFANLDGDPLPEIVVNIGEHIYIYEPDGTLVWDQGFPLNERVNPPVLADFNGDGVQDILVTSWSDTVRLYEYNGGSPTLTWTTTLTTSMAGMFGSPAVADIDGLLPGGDGGPEIAVASNGQLTLLDADGSIIWTTILDPGNPGGVAIADIDGDGEVEMVVSMLYFDGTGTGRMYAVNADGSILWSQPAYDSSSANSVSVLDINADGVYEVGWNGKEQGFTIYNGVDGAILFNEPLANSLTGTDYPAFADVDNDGYSEVIVPGAFAIHVIGFDGGWGNARPVWNQHNYHITNINDDLTVPFQELNSWDVHNTYRTQTELANPLPVYGVEVSHTVGITNVTVLSDTFNVTPDITANPDYGWGYAQTGLETVVTRTFQSRLDDLRPGEARLVAEGTDIFYTLAGGQNRVTLPPLYVAVPHIISLAPAAQTAGLGGRIVYDLLLSNPAAVADTYTLEISGLPAGWAQLPPPQNIGPGANLTIPLTITVPAGAALDAYDFTASVTNGNAGQDSAGAQLAVTDLLDIALLPPLQTGNSGAPVTYTLTISNLETVARGYALSAAGAPQVSLPPFVTVPALSSAAYNITAQSETSGANFFTVSAAVDSGTGGDTAGATLKIDGSNALAVELAPAVVDTGPAVAAAMTVTVRNLGNGTEDVLLEATVPAGWQAELQQNGQPLGILTLSPLAFNSAEVRLLVTPPVGTSPGAYPVSVTATGGGLGPEAPTAGAGGTVNVGQRGVDIAVTSGDTSLNPGDTGAWQVLVTNTGTQADTYDLGVFGFFAGGANFIPASVSLAPGAGQIVNLTASGFNFASAQTVLLGVTATSQTDPAIIAADTWAVSLNAVEGVNVAWQPLTQTVGIGEVATYLVVVSNTGNVATAYEFAANAPAGITLTQDKSTANLPAHSLTYVIVTAVGHSIGEYQLTGTAQSTSSSANASANATLNIGSPTGIDLSVVSISPAGMPLWVWVAAGLLLLAAAGVLFRRRKRTGRAQPG